MSVSYVNLDKEIEGQLQKANIKISLDELDEAEKKILRHLQEENQLSSWIDSFLDMPKPLNMLRSQLKIMIDTDSFYEDHGGIEGYHRISKRLFSGIRSGTEEDSKVSIPPLVLKKDLSSKEVEKALSFLSQTAFIFPVGGAGDRLNLIDKKSGKSLPAALLNFDGKTLLEGLFADVDALERLYRLYTHKSICIPVVLMTSHEKDNHHQICSLLEEKKYFGKDKKNVYFITQSQVPVVDQEGNYLFNSGRIITKPGGHGVLWKLLTQSNFLPKLRNAGIEHLVVRQVNNPLAARSTTILQLLLEATKSNKEFGFVSCSRRVGSPEGMIVLKYLPRDNAEYISNIEYTEFAKFGLEDIPDPSNRGYSKYPANINLLYIKMDALIKAMEKETIPGLLMNAKSSYTKDGQVLKYGRLESTMQSIADLFHTSSNSPLRSFILHMPRSECFSVTKRLSKSGLVEADTPQSAFYDDQAFIHKVLIDHCLSKVIPLPKIENLLNDGYSCLFHFAFCMNPLSLSLPRIIQQCQFNKKSFLSLSTSDVEMKECILNGGLRIEAKSIDKDKVKAKLENITINNKGLNCYDDISKLYQEGAEKGECVYIKLGINAEFYCEGVTLNGPVTWNVPDNTRVIVSEKGGRISIKRSPIKA